MKAFTTLLTPREAREAFALVFRGTPLGTERVPLLHGLGRILAQDLAAVADLPAFDKSTVDGYAVRAADTTGASTGAPAMLTIAAEVSMGAAPDARIEGPQAARIPTGGAVPRGADAVVMQEHTVRLDSTLSVERAVRPGDNIVRRATDVRSGDVVLRAGRRIRPADLGLMAGLGYAEVEVYRRPTVALIVTGDELVPPGRPVRGSQIHDMNTYTLSGMIDDAGAIAKPLGIVGDNLAVLTSRAREAWQSADVLIISGGSSVGEKDYVAETIAAMGDPGIVVHGISIRPGKPTILALVGGKPIFGLPGNVVSVLVTFDQFVRPVLDQLTGLNEPPPRGGSVRARLATRLVSGEREDHVRVALAERAGTIWAAPLPGGSAVITSMVRAEGIVVVPINTVFEVGADVEVRLID
ncbi:MAG TPA: gephyrin-like molybdotransferase Glp [bacterium]|jgi:molybdopterin molybdotransferase